jgi:hypothetical protein
MFGIANDIGYHDQSHSPILKRKTKVRERPCGKVPQSQISPQQHVGSEPFGLTLTLTIFAFVIGTGLEVKCFTGIKTQDFQITVT